MAPLSQPTLVRRTGLPGFEFSRADERAAMGHLLYPIVEGNRPVTGLMSSALVSYLDADDRSSGSISGRKERRRSRVTMRELVMRRGTAAWLNQS